MIFPVCITTSKMHGFYRPARRMLCVLGAYTRNMMVYDGIIICDLSGTRVFSDMVLTCVCARLFVVIK